MSGDAGDEQERSSWATQAASDPDEIRRRYDAWLGDDGRVVDLHAPEGTGYSSLTYLIDVDRDGVTRREVLRSVPTGETVFREYDLALQVACMRNLAEVVPTPTILAHVEDPDVLGAPFYVMAHVDGRIPDDNPPYPLAGWLHDEAPEVQAAHYAHGIDVIAALAGVRPVDVGLADHLVRPELGVTGTDQQVTWWKDLLAWGRDGTDQPTIDAAFEWLDANRPPDPGRDAIVWGDARISNMVFAPDGTPRAVIDWEMAGTGPGEIDLAWFLWMDRQFTSVFGAPRLPGFPGEDELIARWERATGETAQDLDWYLVFAGVRFSITLMRVALRSMADGALPPDADVYRNHLGTRLLAQVLDLPAPGELGLMG